MSVLRGPCPRVDAAGLNFFQLAYSYIPLCEHITLEPTSSGVKQNTTYYVSPFVTNAKK